MDPINLLLVGVIVIATLFTLPAVIDDYRHNKK